jgi:hypothetical protein
MKKHKKAIIIGSVLLVIVIVVVVVFVLGNNPDDTVFSQKPFNDLRTEDISSISVFAIPPNETVLVENVEQIEIIIDILRTVVIYHKSNDWKDSAGQMVIFTINKTKGEVVEVRAYNPYLIVDGQGYKTEYQPCENLNRIANTLLDTRFGGQPIE